MNKIVALCVFLVIPSLILANDCYSCTGSLTGDCATGDPSKWGILSLGEANTHCLTYILKESNNNTAMIARTVGSHGELCELIGEQASRCESCNSSLCNSQIWN